MSWTREDPYVDPIELAAANQRHDAQLHSVPMDPSVPIRSRWASSNVPKGELTDKKINKYQKLGYYSPEYRQARKEFQAKKRARSGNFDLIDGRMIYRP